MIEAPARLAFCVAAVVAVSAPARAADVDAVGARTCATLGSRVDAVAGSAPLLLRSYDVGATDEPALRTAAFTYDNALAVIALLACGHRDEAMRIGEALRLAATDDSRLRNTYRAGPIDGKVLPNGWWDAGQNRWLEDGYQAGTSTGNVAWVALAFVALHDATGAREWSDASRKLGHWIVATSGDERGPGGYRGGIDGFDAAPRILGWKSTEHAIDAVALFERLAIADTSYDWKREAGHARRFVDAMWDAQAGRFHTGTLPDGVTTNTATSALDVQLWSQLVPGALPDWRRALRYAERAHGVGAGFDFNDDRDGEWLEGTAQAALAYRVTGDEPAASRRLAEVATQISPGGYVYATREPRITTGLAIGPASTSADFYYYRRPHLAATAWAALAALNRNPFDAQH